MAPCRKKGNKFRYFAQIFLAKKHVCNNVMHGIQFITNVLINFLKQKYSLKVYNVQKGFFAL